MLALLISAFFTMPANAWPFISSPDWFNRDVADLSGETAGIPEAEGWDDNVSQGLNGVSPQMISVYDFIIGEMNTYNPEFYVVAGDLINGRWFNAATLDMFDPDTRNRTKAIDNAADIYYPWYRWLFERHGIHTVMGAVGDHEVGDDPWFAGSDKALHLGEMKQAFARNMVDTQAFPTEINGVDARPFGTPYEGSSFAYLHNNLLMVSVDVFRQDDPYDDVHPLFGTVSTEVSGAHLAWLADLLDAADQDPSIDHVILQGHTPVLGPVRMQTTSGMMMVDRQDSEFWQLLRQHSHGQGGKVRLYLCGEVHAVTASKDPESDIVQLAHGDPPYGEGTTYVLVFDIFSGRIEIESREFVLLEDGNSLYWQTDKPVTSGPSAVLPSTRSGTLTIDTSGAATSYVASGNLDLVDQTGLTIHFGFDQTTPTGAFSNTGSIGNDHYEGVSHGGLSTQPGMFGDALELNGADAYVESGRGNITEGESRTASAWIRTSRSGSIQTALGYGSDWGGHPEINGRFNMQIDHGSLRLNIGSGVSCLPQHTVGIADGSWHHVAVVLPGDHTNRCADVMFYVDGEESSAGSADASESLVSTPWTNIRVGAGRAGNSIANFFDGAIDDAAIWGSPLPHAKVRSLATAGRHAELGYDAVAMESLFDLFDAGQGEVVIEDLTWSYTTGLSGAGGDVLVLSDRIAIQLDASGNGVAAPAAIAVPLIADNGGPGTSSTGRWRVSGGPDPYGADSLFANAAGATYTYELTLPEPGEYQVFAWWTMLANRRTSVPYDIGHLGGVDTITVNQRIDGGQWNQLGTTWSFDTTATITIRSLGNGGTCADAIMLVPVGPVGNLPPVLDPVGNHSVAAGDTLSFEVSASDNDGTTPLLSATALPAPATFVDQGDGTGIFEWTTTISDLGTYDVTFTATDANDAALTDSETITISVVDAASPLTMDNGDAGTSSTGRWRVSGGPQPFGADSLFTTAPGATYSYTFALATPGEYQVLAWWTALGSRRTSVPYDITHAGGVGTVTVNQRINGGQWNLLGTTWNLGSSATVTIRSLGVGSTCADAIMLVPTGPAGNLPPVLDPIGDQSVTAGEVLSFGVSASDNDGTTPVLSATGLPAEATFADHSNGSGTFEWYTSHSDVGTYAITFIATDANDAALTDTETITVSVVDAASSLTLDNGDAGTSRTGSWRVSGGPHPYGADSVYAKDAGATYSYHFALATPGEYQVFAWWTVVPNRRTSVPYDIDHQGGIDSVTVNQQIDGGQWNRLGTTWEFGATATITIRTLGGGTTCADAIMLVPTGVSGPRAVLDRSTNRAGRVAEALTPAGRQNTFGSVLWLPQ